MENLLLDTRLAFRRLIRNKTFSLVVILSLALGIGANSAIFSVVNSLLLRPLPVPDVDRVVFTLEMRTEDDTFEASLMDAIAFKDAQSFTSTGLGRYDAFRLLGGDRPERINGADVSSEYLHTLGIEPILGRTFTAADDRPGAPRVALIGDSLWKTMFGRDPNILSRNLQLDNNTYSVIGVLPEGFDLPQATNLWIPLRLDIEAMQIKDQADRDYFLVGRLKPGVSVKQANVEAAAIAKHLEQAYPEYRSGWGLKLIPLRQQLIGDITGYVKPTLFLLLAIVGFLLLITCANVASLLLARSVERSHQTAVMISLGAGKKRLISQLIAESMLLSFVGGAVGLLAARVLVAILISLRPVNFIALRGAFEDIHLDGRVVIFTVLISFLTAMLVAPIPGFRMLLNPNLVEQLKEDGQRSGGGVRGRRMFDALMIGEIAVATILLIGAGLMIRSFEKLSDAKLGMKPDHLLAMELAFTENEYTKYGQRVDFMNRLLEQVRAVPGVVSAGTTTNIPLSVSSWDSWYTVEGQPVDTAETPVTAHRIVSPQYLETLGVTLLEGRLIQEQDQPNTTPVVVISKEFAKRAWPGEDPIGKRVKKGHPPQPTAQWLTVVGLVDDVKEDRYNFQVDRPDWYLAYAQYENDIPIDLMVRSSGDPVSLMPSIRRILGGINSNQPISSITTMDARIAEVLGPQRFTALLSSLFAGLGLFLAAIGVYGLTAYSVMQRTKEFSVRMAFGARWADLTRLVVGRGARLAAIGLVLGAVGGFVLGRLLTSLLYEVKATAPEMFLIPILLLLGISILSTALPMFRLTTLDPIDGLRCE
ncbi:MAG: hypothetical protein DMF61_08225 [Blastocatellia bacterium AA13]|nr:MAG: hypothetical protein DMF61_08225 [Blastocatellia bacterium AA13]